MLAMPALLLLAAAAAGASPSPPPLTVTTSPRGETSVRLAPPPYPPGVDPATAATPPTPTDAEFEAAGFVKDKVTGLWASGDAWSGGGDAAPPPHKVLVPSTRADVAALTHALAARRHAWVQRVHGERSVPALVSFMVAEYQQLLADALAVLGLSQPPFEADTLARLVQARIDELYTVLRSVSPTLAAHVTIQNP